MPYRVWVRRSRLWYWIRFSAKPPRNDHDHPEGDGGEQPHRIAARHQPGDGTGDQADDQQDNQKYDHCDSDPYRRRPCGLGHAGGAWRPHGTASGASMGPPRALRVPG